MRFILSGWDFWGWVFVKWRICLLVADTPPTQPHNHHSLPIPSFHSTPLYPSNHHNVKTTQPIPPPPPFQKMTSSWPQGLAMHPSFSLNKSFQGITLLNPLPWRPFLPLATATVTHTSTHTSGTHTYIHKYIRV